MDSMTLTVFASGSTGNCALLSAGGVQILVDAGISARRIGNCLSHWGLSLRELDAIFITHPHSDHISGLQTLTKQVPVPLYATAPVVRQLCYRLPVEERVHILKAGQPVTLSGLEVLPIPTSHDTPGSVGYRFTQLSTGRRACIVTDLGYVTPEVQSGVLGAHVAVIESNHDPVMLQNGPYPLPLQQRIAGREGHLSNAEGAALCALAAQGGAHTVVLAHLSQHNNTPSLALAAAREALKPYSGVALKLAPVLSEGLRCEV